MLRAHRIFGGNIPSDVALSEVAEKKQAKRREPAAEIVATDQCNRVFLG